MVCVYIKFHIGPVAHGRYMILYSSENYLNESYIFFKDLIPYIISVTKLK